MKPLLRIVVLVFLALVSTIVFGRVHEEHAYHIFTTDGLFGLGEADYDNGTGLTTYTPDTDPLPDGVVLDELYLRLEFDNAVPADDQEINLSKLKSIQCGAYEFRPDDPARQFRARRSGRDLIVTYSFLEEASLDPASEIVRAGFAEDCWKIAVAGEETIEVVDFAVTFHKNGLAAMPDYYLEDPYEAGDFSAFGGRGTLYAVDDANVLQGEKNCAPISEGSPVPDTAKKLVVQIHGWNPNSHQNHYAPEPAADPCDGHLLEDTGSTNPDHRLEFKWENLVSNLLGNRLLGNDWLVTRYDWAQDAATGACGFFGKDEADASRDAAVVHGFKLVDHAVNSVTYLFNARTGQ